jgi:hypothetical protein
MSRALLALLALLVPFSPARGENEPRVAEQRIVLRTGAGDIAWRSILKSRPGMSSSC